MEKWLISQLGQDLYKMGLGNLVIPESKKLTVITRPEPRSCCVILTLYPHPDHGRKGDSDSPIHSIRVPRSRVRVPLSGLPESCVLAQLGRPCSGLRVFHNENCSSQSIRVLWPFVLICSTARNDHEICVYQMLL